MKKLLPFVPLILIAGLLTACGFRINTMPVLPDELQSIQLVGNQNSDMYRLIRGRLHAAGAQLVTTPGPQTAILSIRPLAQISTVASLRPNVTTAETVVNIHTSYTLQIPGHKPKEFFINFNRSYATDGGVLSASVTEETIGQEMTQLTVNQIIQQLGRFKP